MAAEPRFLTLSDVADVLNISTSQAYALVRNKELEAIKVGGRGQWRVERDKLEEYIERMYAETRHFLASHPFAFDEVSQSGFDEVAQREADKSANAPDAGERAQRD
jgi:excisionase family DNA binding protein